MAEVAHVLVVLPRAREPERVVAADGVSDDLDERLEVVVEELRVEPRLRVRAPHQRPCRGRVEASLVARLQLLCVEREEVGALPSLDVDDLDVLPCLHLVRERRRAIDLEVEPGVGEGLGQPRRELLERSRASRSRARDRTPARRPRRRSRPHRARPRRRGAAARREGLSRRRAASTDRRAPRHGPRRVDAAGSHGVDDLGGAVLARADERAKHGRVAVRARPEPVEPVGADTEGRDLGCAAHRRGRGS